MSRPFIGLFSFIVGPVLGVLFVYAMCSMPWLTFSTACGHNAAIWFFLTVPVGVVGCWITLAALAKHYGTRQPDQAHVSGNDA